MFQWEYGKSLVGFRRKCHNSPSWKPDIGHRRHLSQSRETGTAHIFPEHRSLNDILVKDERPRDHMSRFQCQDWLHDQGIGVSLSSPVVQAKVSGRWHSLDQSRSMATEFHSSSHLVSDSRRRMDEQVRYLLRWRLQRLSMDGRQGLWEEPWEPKDRERWAFPMLVRDFSERPRPFSRSIDRQVWSIHPTDIESHEHKAVLSNVAYLSTDVQTPR